MYFVYQAVKWAFFMGKNMNKQLEIIQVPLIELKIADYNPRKWSEEAIRQLSESIKRFGLVDPIIVNGADNRKNVVIGGHFRLKVAKDLGYKEIPVVYVNIPDIEKEKELNLRLNKNIGEWDWNLLASFDEIGFTTRSGKKVGLSLIYLMLKNPFYYGEFEYPVNSGNWYRGSHPPLITKEIFNKVQKQLVIPFHKAKWGSKTFTFKDLLICGSCGASFIGEDRYRQRKIGDPKIISTTTVPKEGILTVKNLMCQKKN